MLFLGADPGLDGALAWFDPARDFLDIADFPLKPGTREPDGAKLMREMMRRADDTVSAAIEIVKPHPRQKMASAKKLLDTASRVKQCLDNLQIPWIEIDPAVWRREAGLPSLKGKRDKEPSRQLAGARFINHQHYFQRVKDADRAEAALIAWVAARRYEREMLE